MKHRPKELKQTTIDNKIRRQLFLSDITNPSLKTFKFKKEVKHNAHQDNWNGKNNRFFGCLKYFKYGSSIKKNDHPNENKCTY